MKAVIKEKVLGIVIKTLNNVPDNATEKEKENVLNNVCKAYNVQPRYYILETV